MEILGIFKSFEYRIEQKTIDYLNNVEVENLQEKIKVNYLLSFFSVKERYEVNISSYLMGL